MLNDSIEKKTSKLVRNKDGYPVFPDTTADLRYVDKAISREDADDATSATFMQLIEKNRKLAWTIIDQHLDPMKYEYKGPRVINKK